MRRSPNAPSLRWLPRLLTLVVALLAAPASAAAQPAERPVATLRLGDRELAVGVGSDGLVTVVLGSYRYGDGRTVARERSFARERYEPDDVITWVEDVRRWAVAASDSVRHASGLIGFVSPALGRSWKVGRQLRVSLSHGASSEASIVLGQCVDDPEAFVEVRREDLARFLWALERATVAIDLLRAPWQARPPAAAAPDSAFEEHQVSCPARARASNPRPELPVAPDDVSSYELLASFVVDSAGRPETATLRTLPGSDRRFVASFEETLPIWRYVPARRAGRRVRQRVHVAVPFRRWPTVAPASGPEIPVGPAGDGSARIAVGPLRNQFWSGAVSEEREYVFDLVSAARAMRWADTVAAHLGGDARLARACDVLQCGFTLREPAGAGITLVVDRQGQGELRYHVGLERCDGAFSPRHDVSLEEARALVARVRAAARVAAGRRRLATQANGGRARYGYEVACPADELLTARSSSQAWAFDGWRSGEMVVSRFVVDSAGKVDPRSVSTMPGASREATDSLGYLLRTLRFTPATLGGRRVRQFVHWAVPIDVSPPEPFPFLRDPYLLTGPGHGAVLGVVMTPDGGMAAGAEVSLVRADAAERDDLPPPYSAVADPSGSYAIPVVLPGSYRLEVRAPGHRRPEVERVTVQATQRSEVNVLLRRR